MLSRKAVEEGFAPLRRTVPVMAAHPSDSWDRWNGYYYFFGEDQRCVVTFNVAACDPKNQRPSCGRRLIGFSPKEYVSPQGMPVGPAFERLKAIESRASTLLGQNRVACRLVGKHVYHGLRELLFQIEDSHVPAFDRVAAQVEDELGGTELVGYEGWQFFNDKIRPNERARAHIANREVLEQLEKHGANFAKPHMLDHTFVGSPEALGEIRRVLLEKGFAERGLTGTSLTVAAEAALDQDEIDELTARLRAYAGVYEVTYDGWGTMIDPS